MKRVLTIALSVLCLLWCSFASSIGTWEWWGSSYIRIKWSQNDYQTMVNKVTKKCYDNYGIDSKTPNGSLFSKCYRDEINKKSISKTEICSHSSDGIYLSPIQFSRNFSSDYNISHSFWFFKRNDKIYYNIDIQLDAAGGSIRWTSLYEYDCQKKKSKSVIKYGSNQREKYNLVWSLPLWIEENGVDSYHLAWWGKMWDVYNPISIVKINLKTKKATSYNIFSEIKVDENWVKTFIPSSFKWWNPLSLFTDMYETSAGKKASDPKKWIIRLYNIVWWIGILSISTSDYDISLDVDFNKKTIK